VMKVRARKANPQEKAQLWPGSRSSTREHEVREVGDEAGDPCRTFERVD
jgi:hypothetical protein